MNCFVVGCCVVHIWYRLNPDLCFFYQLTLIFLPFAIFPKVLHISSYSLKPRILWLSGFLAINTYVTSKIKPKFIKWKRKQYDKTTSELTAMLYGQNDITSWIL